MPGSKETPQKRCLRSLPYVRLYDWSKVGHVTVIMIYGFAEPWQDQAFENRRHLDWMYNSLGLKLHLEELGCFLTSETEKKELNLSLKVKLMSCMKEKNILAK